MKRTHLLPRLDEIFAAGAGVQRDVCVCYVAYHTPWTYHQEDVPEFCVSSPFVLVHPVFDHEASVLRPSAPLHKVVGIEPAQHGRGDIGPCFQFVHGTVGVREPSAYGCASGLVEGKKAW